jgi:uncharacterized membrane protein YhhN
MHTLFWAGASVTLVALVALLVAEWRHSGPGRWLSKPVASTGFMLAASSGLGSGYAAWVLAALVLCWLGDVLLIPASKATFLAGLGSFLLGHVAFGVAFAARGVSSVVVVVALGVVALPALGVWRWLEPHVPTGMRAPVAAYIVVISLMVALAIGTCWISPSLPIVAGAVAFFLSDLAVARDRFVAPGFGNRAWGLPLYYAAVLLLAASGA